MPLKGAAPQVFSYQHESDTLTSANYFDPVADLLEPGDIILASKVASGTASELKVLYVATVAAGVVTVADASAL